MVRIAITGGLGYLGSGIAQRLLEEGNEVVIVDDGSTGKVDHHQLRGEQGSRTAIHYDLAEGEVAGELLRMAGADVILHLAAVAGVEACAAEPARAWDVNVTATAEIAEWCRETETPIAFASTAGVYHPLTSMPLAPERPRRPPHYYGQTKRAAEDVLEATLEGAAPSLSIEMTNLYGSHDVNGEPVSKPTVVNFFADRARRGEPLTVHEPGSQGRDLLHVRDAIRGWREAVYALLDDDVDGQERIILGSGAQATIHGLADLVADVAAEQRGVDPEVSLVENPRGGPYYGDVDVSLEAASRVLDGWTPQESIEETIEEELAGAPA